MQPRITRINITELSEVKMEVKMEVNSLHSWKLKWTIVNEAASIQGYRPARSALLPASEVLYFQPATLA